VSIKNGNKTDKLNSEKITSSKLAQKLGIKSNKLIEELTNSGYLEEKENKPYLTKKGKEAGGEFKISQQHGPYFIWPDSFTLE